MQKSTAKTLSLLGFVLSGVLSGSIAHAKQFQGKSPTEQDVETAALLGQLIDRGHVTIDGAGHLILKSEVLQVLKDFDLVVKTKTPEITAMGGCSGTTGEGGGTYRPER